MQTTSLASETANLQSIREDLLRQAYRILLGLGGLLFIGNVLRYLDTGWKPVYGAFAVAYLVLVLAYMNLPRISYRVAAGLLFALVIGAPSAGLFAFGIAGNAIAVYLASCVIATVIAGARGGFVVLGIAAVLLVGTGLAKALGAYQFEFDAEVFFGSTTSWIAVIATFVALSAVVVTQVGSLRERLASRIQAERDARRSLTRQVEERRSTQQALRMSRERFRLGFNASPHYMAISDYETTRLIEVNDAFTRLTGISREETIGRTAAELGFWTDPTMPMRIRAAIVENGVARDLRGQVRSRAGGTIELLLSGVPVEVQGRRSLFVVARDVSAEAKVGRRLQEMQGELERRVAARTRELESATADLEGFVYSVSHDLRPSLRAVLTQVHLLRQGLEGSMSQAARERLERVEGATQRSERLVNSLLEVSRIGRRQLVRESVDLSVLAEEVVATLRAESPGREVELRIEPGMVAQADRVLMRLVLENLLGNAWKFTARVPRARIEFDCARGAEETVYSVRDNGAGFDMAYAGKLFEPFERLHAPKEFEGTGIGLATVARAIRRHDGRVWADSRPGHGAVFRFVIGEPYDPTITLPGRASPARRA